MTYLSLCQFFKQKFIPSIVQPIFFIFVIFISKPMKTSHQNIRNFNQADLTNIYPQRKFNYLNNEQFSLQGDFFQRPKILQTISEQAPSQDKGSVSNRSENNVTKSKIYKNVSEGNINSNNIPAERTPLGNIFSRTEYLAKQVLGGSSSPLRNSNIPSFQKKPSFTQRDHQNFRQNNSTCYQCTFYNRKIAQLQASYELLLQAKNEELEECKIIIFGLEQRLQKIQRRSQQQIERNKKFRSQIQRKNNEEFYQRQKQNQMIEYLKNRQIELLEKLKQLQNQVYITEIKGGKSKFDYKQKKNNHNSSQGFNSTKNKSKHQNKSPFNLAGIEIVEKNKENFHLQDSRQYSIGEYSAKTFDQESNVQERHYFQSIDGIQKSRQKQMNVSGADKSSRQLIDRVPLGEILKKSNQIQCLKDSLLVSQLKIRIQQTKNYQKDLLIR